MTTCCQSVQARICCRHRGFRCAGVQGGREERVCKAVSPVWVRSAGRTRGGSRMSDGRNAIAARFSVYGLRGTHTRSAEPVAAEPSVWRSGRARAARAACCPRCPYCLRCLLSAACCVQKLSTRAGGGVEPRAALVTCGENRSRLQACPPCKGAPAACCAIGVYM